MKRKITDVVGNVGLVLLILLILFAAFIAILPITSPLIFQDDVVITVTNKERVVNGDNSKYLVWGKYEDGSEETFQVTDQFVGFLWNSSDRYGKLKENQKYRIHVHGIRITFMSKYRNIGKVEELSDGTENQARVDQ